MLERDFQLRYRRYRDRIEKQLTHLYKNGQPSSVYAPIRFVLGSGGKRLRAFLTMLSCEAVGQRALHALDAAAAIEMLHNFTLVHDDVMDHAALRRGRPTVHTKWDENVAILIGDEMIALAYRSIMKTRSSRIVEVLRVFTEAFTEVCEGQGLDKEFETKTRVHINEHRSMIEKKTARMISAACEIGGLIGNGTGRQVRALRTFGRHLGIAFQMKDDILDITGDAEEFGKTIGGDIKERKKTFLLLTALERTRGSDRRFLQSLMARNGRGRVDVDRVRAIYDRADIINTAEAEIKRSTRSAQRALAQLPPSRAKEMLVLLSNQLLERNH